MAEREKDKQAEQAPKPANSEDKSGSILHSILVVLLALFIVAAVTAGVFYFAVKNNINGLADTLRPQIKDHPIFSIALPKEPEPDDPDDPKYLSEKEILEKYNEYRQKAKDLENKLLETNAEIEKLKGEAKLATDTKNELSKNQELIKIIKEEQDKLDKDKKALAELIAKGDTDSFKEYFQKVDKATAETIYKQIITEQKIDEQKAALAKPFSVMEPKNAAKVLTELYAQDKNTLLNIFEGLKANQSALILEQMDSKTAAEITKLLSDRKGQ